MGFLSGLKKAWKAVKKAVNRVVQVATAAVTTILNAVKLGLIGILRIPAMIGTLLGYLPLRQMRVYVKVLSNEQGIPLIHTAEDRRKLLEALGEARRIFRDQVNVILVPLEYRESIKTIRSPAPKAALKPRCVENGGAFADDFSDAGTFFRKHLVTTVASIFTGYAVPITVFIVEDVQGKKGCCLVTTDYVTVDLSGIREAPSWTLAHELGHANNLFHWRSGDSLMRSGSIGRKDYLKWWQKPLVRSSRHVTVL